MQEDFLWHPVPLAPYLFLLGPKGEVAVPILLAAGRMVFGIIFFGFLVFTSLARAGRGKRGREFIQPATNVPNGHDPVLCDCGIREGMEGDRVTLGSYTEEHVLSNPHTELRVVLGHHWGCPRINHKKQT